MDDSLKWLMDIHHHPVYIPYYCYSMFLYFLKLHYSIQNCFHSMQLHYLPDFFLMTKKLSVQELFTNIFYYNVVPELNKNYEDPLYPDHIWPTFL